MTPAEKEAFDYMERACREFVWKVENGYAKSRKSYVHMTEALLLVDALPERQQAKKERP